MEEAISMPRKPKPPTEKQHSYVETPFNATKQGHCPNYRGIELGGPKRAVGPPGIDNLSQKQLQEPTKGEII
jgi:hypothetical protein